MFLIYNNYDTDRQKALAKMNEAMENDEPELAAKWAQVVKEIEWICKIQDADLTPKTIHNYPAPQPPPYQWPIAMA
jgi:hypothetical protein